MGPALLITFEVGVTQTKRCADEDVLGKSSHGCHFLAIKHLQLNSVEINLEEFLLIEITKWNTL